jgi:hypothetical protein
MSSEPSDYKSYDLWPGSSAGSIGISDASDPYTVYGDDPKKKDDEVVRPNCVENEHLDWLDGMFTRGDINTSEITKMFMRRFSVSSYSVAKTIVDFWALQFEDRR